MTKLGSKIKTQITQQGQHYGYWVRKFNSLLIGGNGAALVLLGSFMSKSSDPIQQLQSNKFYFLPFLVGIIFTGIATIAGARAERTLVSLNLTLDEGDELRIARQLPPGEYKRDAEAKYFKAKYSFERVISFNHICSAGCFLLGLLFIAFV